MEKVSIKDVEVEPNPLGVHEIRKPVSRALGTTDFAMNYFELEPGESFSGGLHTHHDQEEVFYVMEGTAVFETPDDEHVVEAGELIRFAPGEYQQGVNDPDEGEGAVVGWALGAPGSMHDWSELESLVYCRECEEETGHSVDLEGTAFSLECTECGNGFTVGG